MVGSLSKALANLGVKVIVVMPAYRTIHHERHGIHPCLGSPNFRIPFGKDYLSIEVYQGSVPGTEIDVYFLRCGSYFDRDGVYDDPVTREGFADNMQRFIAFMRAAIHLLSRLRFPLDVLHCHDLHTGLIPAILRINNRDDSFWDRVGILYTIHNAAYQGVYPKESLYWAGIDPRHFYPGSPFEFWGQTNFLKAGIEYADLLSTVSKTYAAEIQSSAEFGYGLEGVLSKRKADLSGIVNGIDYDVWNPETDPYIPSHFSTGDLSGKAVCKAELQKAFGLPQRSKVPLIGIVSRLVDQKGLDLVGAAISEIGQMDLQIVVLGIGQQKYHDMFNRFALQYPLKISVRLEFENKLSHQIEAGCDMFLMPSRYEPCGLNQLYSLRYGTIPIVRSTGGLADTVMDYDPDSDKGTGFVFVDYSAGAMMAAVKRALNIYADHERWQGLMLRDMLQDCSWEKSATKYVQLYERIHSRRADSSKAL